MGGPQHKQDTGPRGSPTTAPSAGVEPFDFGTALREFALSTRRRLAGVSLATALPLAAAGLTGVSSASEQAEQSVPPKVAPAHTGQRAVAQTVSEDDAKAIVTNFKKRVGTSGAIETLLAEHESAHQPGSIRNNSYSRVRTLSGKDALAMLRTISEGKRDSPSETATYLLSELDVMLASPIFQKGVATIRETNAGCKAPMGEMTAVWSQPEADREQFLHILRSPGFQAYQHNVHAATGVDLQTKLVDVVAEYTAYQSDPSRAVGPELKPAIDQFKATIPELPLVDINELRQVLTRIKPQDEEPSPKDPRESFEGWLHEVRCAFEILGSQHSVRVQSLAELHISVINEIAKFDLQREDVKELGRYLATNYPDLDVGREWPSKFVSHDNGFLHGFARPILDELRTDGPTMRRFLALYGKDFGEVDLSDIGPHTPKNSPTGIEGLIENEAFTEFLDRQFAKYPSLQATLTTEQIFQLSAAFACREEYDSLNSQLVKRSQGNAPDLSLHEIESKHKLLETLEQCGFDVAIVSQVDEKSWGIRDFSKAIKMLQTPSARELYDAIRNQWGLEKFDVAYFCGILNGRQEHLDFFLNAENSRKFAAICKLYPIAPESSSGADLSSLSIYAPDIVSKEQILLRSDLAAYLKRYDSSMFKDSPDGERYTSLYELANIPERKSFLIANLEKFDAAARQLEGKYGADPRTACEILEDTRNIDRQLEILSSPSVAALFDSLDGAFLDAIGSAGSREEFRRSLTLADRLGLAARISVAEGIEATTRQAIAAGGEITTGNSLAHLIQECYDNTSVRKALSDPAFIKLVRELDRRFFNGTVNLGRFREYEELYTELKDEPGALESLFSPEFAELTSFLGQQFQVATEQASTLRPSLRVSKGLDLSAFMELTQQLRAQGETISSNDIVLLSEISKDSNLRDRLSDRQTLLDNLSPIYERAVFPRKHLDQLSNMPEPSQVTDEEMRSALIKERKAIRDAYTERPPLAKLSTMQLLRLSLIEEMLRRDDVQEHLGALVAKDIATPSTELGGAIMLERGRASLREHQSSSFTDGSFSSYKYDKFVDGLGTFHLHALQIDESEYAGPSGWLGMPFVDVGYVDRLNVTDTVFTVMGHPSDEDGNPVQSKVRVNADVYFVDKRDPRNPALRIIDLGEVVVPYKPPAE